MDGGPREGKGWRRLEGRDQGVEMLSLLAGRGPRAGAPEGRGLSRNYKRVVGQPAAVGTLDNDVDALPVSDDNLTLPQTGLSCVRRMEPEG